MEKSTYVSHLRVQSNHWWFNARQQIIETLLAPYEQEIRGGEILDIGSGGGRILTYLSRLGRVRAMDVEPTVIQHISGQFGTDVAYAGRLPDSVPFRPESFRLVTTLDVLEHVEDDTGSFGKIYDLLCHGGLYFLTVPAHQCFWSYHDDQSHHIRRYNHKDLERKLLAAGFKIEKMTFFNTFLLLPILLARFVRNSLSKDAGGLRNDMDIVPEKTGLFLEWIFKSEKYWLRRRRFPVGLSLVAIARKT